MIVTPKPDLKIEPVARDSLSTARHQRGLPLMDRHAATPVTWGTKHKSKTFLEVMQNDAQYLKWVESHVNPKTDDQAKFVEYGKHYLKKQSDRLEKEARREARFQEKEKSRRNESISSTTSDSTDSDRSRRRRSSERSKKQKDQEERADRDQRRRKEKSRKDRKSSSSSSESEGQRRHPKKEKKENKEKKEKKEKVHPLPRQNPKPMPRKPSGASSSTDQARPMDVDEGERRRTRQQRNEYAYRRPKSDTDDGQNQAEPEPSDDEDPAAELDPRMSRRIQHLTEKINELQLEVATLESRSDYKNKETLIYRWKNLVQGTMLIQQQEVKVYLRLARNAVKVRTEQLEDTWLLAEEPSRSRPRR